MDYSQIRADHFRKTIIPESDGISGLIQAASDYQLIVLCTLKAILDRYEANPDYHFIDTKLSLIDGRDFPDDDRLRGKDTIYSYIQGRGLEALALHGDWVRRQANLSDSLKEDLSGRIQRLLREVLDQMEHLRQLNGGHLFFTMTPSGQALKIENGELREHRLGAGSNFSDLFYVKGMAAASRALGDKALFESAQNLFKEICDDLRTGRFYSDQQSLNTNPVGEATGRHSHGGRMIGIGAAACLLECTGDSFYRDVGLEFIDHVLRYHVAMDDPKIGERYDMWEFTDDAREPYVRDGVLLSDPGHATEFVGLSLKLTGIAKATSDHQALETVLPEVLRRNFMNGFAKSGCGIVKSVNLITRQPVDSMMPWWSLPETMRAAIEAASIAPDGPDKDFFYSMAARCSNAFLGHYVRPDIDLMSTQTLDEQGIPVAVIPATPDADPGYHTGLSLIDCLDLLEKQTCS